MQRSKTLPGMAVRSQMDRFLIWRQKLPYKSSFFCSIPVLCKHQFGHPSGRIDFWRIWESIAIQPLLRNKSSYCLDCLQILLVCIPSLRKNLSIDSLYDDFPCVDGYMAALIKLHNQFTQGRDVHSRTRLLFAIPKKAHAAM